MLNGKVLFSHSTKESANPQKGEDQENLAVVGEVLPKSGVPKFAKFEYDITLDNKSFHVSFLGAVTTNRMSKAYLVEAKNAGAAKTNFYDAQQILGHYYDMYTTDSHTGVRIPVLEDEYERNKIKDVETLSGNEIEQRIKAFSNNIAICLQKLNIEKILEMVPRKKNMYLHKGRVTLLAKDTCTDCNGNTYVLYAKNVSDADLDITLKRVYVGEDIYSQNEIISYL